MAFPVVQTADTKNGTVTSNSTSWTLTYPTNLASGDLILALAAADGAPSFTFPANWTRNEKTDLGPVAGVIGWKISDGTETGTFTLTLSASEQGAWRIFRITSWFGSGTPNSSSNTTDINAAGGADTYATGATANPNPPSLNPTNWATEDTLWLAACAVDTSRTVSAYPAILPDLRTADVSGGAGGATLGIAMLSSAVASVDPDTFTISASDDWVAFTVAVRPAAAVEFVPRHSAINHQNPAVLAKEWVRGKAGVWLPPRLWIPRRPALVL